LEPSAAAGLRYSPAGQSRRPASAPLITPRLYHAIGTNAVRAAARLVRDNFSQNLLGDAEDTQESLTNAHFSTHPHCSRKQ